MSMSEQLRRANASRWVILLSLLIAAIIVWYVSGWAWVLVAAVIFAVIMLIVTRRRKTGS